MDSLENIFSSDNETVEKLKSYAIKLDFKKVFFEHLGPELKKLFENKKDKVYLKNFIEACQYEYGFFDKEIDLQKAFSLYKKYADLNDYFCMYKMHVIYLCEYEKFNVPFNRVLEKIYLLKCFAYLPNYIYDWNIKLFETIDVIYELAEVLDLEDSNLDKHPLFLDILNYQREEYNLTENDILLMKGTFSCFFHKDDAEANLLSFCLLNSLEPKNELDYAYYIAKNKCIYFQTYLKLDKVLSDSDIENFYKEIENKKLYDFYCDYGNYLLEKTIKPNPETIEIFKTVTEQGNLFGSFRAYQSSIDFYEYDEIITDYNKASALLDYLLDEIVFENLSLRKFILLMGFLVKYSNFSEKIIEKYLIYVKEINDDINSILKRKEKENEQILEDEDYFFDIKAYIYYFGFKGIEEQNLQKAIENLDKAFNTTNKNHTKKSDLFFKYNIKVLMNDLKLISNDELIKEKKELHEFFIKNLNIKYEITDCYLLGEDYYEGFTKKKDELDAYLIYKSAQNIICKDIIDKFYKNKMKKFLETHQEKIENKIKDETCCICYDKKVDKTFIPCKHNFCSVCVDKLEKDSRCPVCRGDILCVI